MPKIPTAATATREQIAEAQQIALKRKLFRELRELKELTHKSCSMCGERFLPSRAWQLFCSDLCRIAFHKKKGEDTLLEIQQEIEDLRSENKTLKERLKKYETDPVG